METEPAAARAAACAESLLGVIRQEREILQSLLGHINNELRALQGNDIAALEHAIHEKDRCLDTLLQLDRQRRSQLADAGFSAESADFERFLDACDAAQQTPLKEDWETVRSLSARCLDANSHSAQLNATAQRMIKQMLAHLRGEQSRPEVYDRNGAVATPDSKALARA